MPEQPNKIIDFTAAATEKLGSRATKPEMRRHIIEMLKNKRYPYTESSAKQDPLPDDAVLLTGQDEIIYYALLLKDAKYVKWDSQSKTPRPAAPWIDIANPKVKAAQDLLRAYPEKMGVISFSDVDPVIDASQIIWRKASKEQRAQIIRMMIADPQVGLWISCEGVNPVPDSPIVLHLDAPNIQQYLPEDWREFVATEVEKIKKQRFQTETH